MHQLEAQPSFIREFVSGIHNARMPARALIISTQFAFVTFRIFNLAYYHEDERVCSANCKTNYSNIDCRTSPGRLYDEIKKL